MQKCYWSARPQDSRFPQPEKTIAFEPNRFIVAYNDYKADMNSALANDFTKILSWQA